MIQNMTPMRWLRVIGCVAVLYVFGICVTALDGVWNVPQQLNSVILTSLATVAIIAARAERDRRAEVRLQMETAERDAGFHAKLDEVRRHVCWMEATAQPVLAGASPAVRPEPPAADDLDDYAKGLVDGLAGRSKNGRVLKLRTQAP